MNAHKMSPVKHAMARLSASGAPHSPGIYILYKANMGPPHFVGRADTDLFETLTVHRGNAVYPYFKFMQCKSADDGFQWECIYWHQGSSTLDNGEAKGGRHPQRPKGSEAKCPVPGCTHQLVHVSAPVPEEIVQNTENS